MSIKRSHLRSARCISRIEALESRELLSATLVEITIPTTTPPVKHVVKHAVKHKAAKPAAKPATNSGHAIIGYESFAG